MNFLESNGYRNVTGLKRRFAIEVEDYDKKERLIQDLFSKSRVPNTELFALDIALVVQLLSSLEGKQIYPENVTKENEFEIATNERQLNIDNMTRDTVPDGEYYLKNATMKAKNGTYTVKKGSQCSESCSPGAPKARKDARIVNGVLQEDVPCTAVTTAAWVVLGQSTNGWMAWKNSDNDPIDIYRNRDDEE